jgi:hypothetical protein
MANNEDALKQGIKVVHRAKGTFKAMELDHLMTAHCATSRAAPR